MCNRRAIARHAASPWWPSTSVVTETGPSGHQRSCMDVKRIPQRRQTLFAAVRLTSRLSLFIIGPDDSPQSVVLGLVLRRRLHEQPGRSHLRPRYGGARAVRSRRRVAVARLRVAHVPPRAARQASCRTGSTYPEGNNGLCTAECESDSDCDRVPESPCMTGFTCGVAVTVGPFCCRKFCICKDYIVIPDRGTLDDADGVRCERAGERVLQPERPRRQLSVPALQAVTRVADSAAKAAPSGRFSFSAAPRSAGTPDRRPCSQRGQAGAAAAAIHRRCRRCAATAARRRGSARRRRR